MMTYIEQHELSKVADLDGFSLYASTERMAEVYQAAMLTGGIEPVVNSLKDNEVTTFLNMLAAVDGVERDEARAKYMNGEYGLYLLHEDGREYRVEKENGEDDFWTKPQTGTERSLARSPRIRIVAALDKNTGVWKDKSPMFNMYVLALMRLCGMEGEKEERGEEPGVERLVIRERVIEREKEPELEGMLRGFMAEAITKVAVDDMVPRIKERIIEEFGIEPQRHVVKVLDNERTFDGVVHEKFDTVMHFIANRTPVYMYGPTGTGKGELVKQVAKSLGLGFYAMNSVTDEFKIAGFIDANGIYHETEFYRAFTKGGLFFLDEMDASAPEVMVCLNMALADGYYTFPNGRFEAHDDFRVVAAGNTLGTGADSMYTGRLQLDAASLNRFVVIPVGYDERIDSHMAQGDEELVEFAKQYRKSLKECGLQGACSYRNIQQIKVSQAAMSDEEALCFCLTKEMNRDDINTMVGRGLFDEGNRYFKALKKVESLVG